MNEFPLDYGLCVCNPNCTAIELCEITVEQDLFSNATSTSDGPSLDSSITDGIAYTFNGANNVDNNWVLVSNNAKTNILQMIGSSDQKFTVSCWINIASNSATAYIFSFERGSERYFSLYERSQTRANLFYFRDRIAEPEDSGYTSQVALSFYYDTDIFPDGLRDRKWHFLALTIDYPEITLTIDGYVHRPTQGNYYDVSNTKILLDRLTNGSTYDMPAEIINVAEADFVGFDDINGYIGGSSRGNTRTYSLDGTIRQLLLTSQLDTEAYNCLGSCNVTIYSDGSVSGFNTFYNPARRSFEFSSSADPSEPIGDTEYTEFMGTLIFSDNGFLPSEEEEESWRVSVQVSERGWDKGAVGICACVVSHFVLCFTTKLSLIITLSL